MKLEDWCRFDGVEKRSLCACVKCPPEWRWCPPPLPDFDFWLVVSGEGEVVWPGRKLMLEPGKLLVLPPGSVPDAQQDPENPLEVVYFHFWPLRQGQPLPKRSCPPPNDVHVHQFQQLAWIQELARHTARYGHRNDATGLEVWQHHVALLLTAIEEEEANQQRPAQREDWPVLELMEAIRFAPEADWTVEAMGQRVGLSRSQLHRRFAAVAGMSPTAFVIEQRLERAGQLLRGTDLTLEAIADRLGYRDVFFFAKQFKEKKGLAPGRYRQTLH